MSSWPYVYCLVSGCFPNTLLTRKINEDGREMVSSTELNAKSDALQRLRDGDEDAFGELFALYRPRLFQIISVRMDRRLAGRVDADDVLQEAYLDASKRLDNFLSYPSGTFFVWLRLVTTQTMTNIYRRHFDVQMRDVRRDVSMYSEKVCEGVAIPVVMQPLGRLTSPSKAAIRDETVKQAMQSMELLKEMDREIILLRHFEQLENKEIAEVLGIKEKAASIRYVRAIKRLKDLVVGVPENDTEIQE